MTADERIAEIAPKLNRAKKHFRDLESEIASYFFDPRPYEVATKKDPNTGEIIYYVAGVRPVPSSINVLVGDVLHNCRATLDHLAYQLVLFNNGTPTRNTAYPIFDSAAKYHAEKARLVKGMRQDAINLIDATSPYQGGDSALWRLHQLNIIDKHRLLITTTSAYRGHSIQESEWNELYRTFGENLPAGLARVKFIHPTGNPVPLKDGSEFFRAPAGSKVDDNMELAIDVLFAEPLIVDGETVLKVLQRMLDIVRSILYGNRPVFI